ncbi:MAG: hypothetical protein JXB62_07160 [Pirellulales bacterium]|nr:hypothetical protein [Pirellulales bacterium]
MSVTTQSDGKESDGSKWPSIVGWMAVVCSAAITCFWAFWGIIENFHEGWHYESLWANIALMFAQYLSPMLVFLAVGLVAIRWPRIGSLLHVGFAVFLTWLFGGFTDTIVLLIAGPLLLLAAAYWFGRIKRRRTAAAFLVGATLITLIACGVEPAVRVAGRLEDGDLGARVVQGNGVTLVWAPVGPGWPREGVDWDEAVQRCRHLTADGTKLADEPQDIWRLPTVDEAVRSMHRHGKHCGGRWDAQSGRTVYDVKPDKESPLWDIHAQLIYWWTADEIDAEKAYMIVYDGRVRERKKTIAPTYFAFRAVKSVDSSIAGTQHGSPDNRAIAVGRSWVSICVAPLRLQLSRPLLRVPHRTGSQGWDALSRVGHRGAAQGEIVERG